MVGIFFSSAFLIFAGLAFVRPAGAAPMHPELDGKEVFLAQKCNMCHSVSAAGIEATVKSEKMRGPDVTGVTKEAKDEVLANYLRRKGELNGKKHQKPFTGSDEELGALLAWLHTLEEKQ